jgi:hypothetical protein
LNIIRAALPSFIAALYKRSLGVINVIISDAADEPAILKRVETELTEHDEGVIVF